MNRIYLVILIVIFSCIDSYAQMEVSVDTLPDVNVKRRKSASGLIPDRIPYTALSISNSAEDKDNLYQLLLKIYGSSIYYQTGDLLVSGSGVPIVLLFNYDKTEQQSSLSKAKIEEIPIESIKSIEAICNKPVVLPLYGLRAVYGIFEITLDELHLDKYAHSYSPSNTRDNPKANVTKGGMSRLNGDLQLSDETPSTKINRGNLYQMSLEIYSAFSYYKTGKSGLPAKNAAVLAIYNRDRSRLIRMSKEEIEQIPSGSVKSMEFIYGTVRNTIYRKAGISDGVIEITLDRQ